MLVVFEGIDGSGKTTLARRTIERLAAAGVEAYYAGKSAPTTSNEYVTGMLAQLKSLLWPDDDGSLHHHLGDRYWLYLMAAWFAAKQKNSFAAERCDARIALYDGWWYRFVAKFLNKGFDEAWLLSLFSDIQEPDVVIVLDIEPRIAWLRRSTYKEPEMGRSDGLEGDAFGSYCTYQGSIRRHLLSFAARRGWHVVSQAADDDEDQVLAKVVAVLDGTLSQAM